MPEDKELGPSHASINRWLEGVETAINEGTLYGRQEDKTVVWTGCRRKSVPFMISDRLKTDDTHGNQQIEWLDLENSRACNFLPQHFTTKDKNTILILPNISSQANQNCLRTTENSLTVIDLEYRIENEFMREDTRMESISSADEDKFYCQESITEDINELSLNDHNNNDDDGLSDDEFSKCPLFSKRHHGDNSKDQLTIISETVPKDLIHMKTTSKHTRVETPCNQDKTKFTLPPLKSTDGRRHTVPSITVCQEGENRASKGAEKDSAFDPRFLMPTESSIEKARYMLASRRGSLPCTGTSMRLKSLDMVAEEQPTDSIQGESTVTSRVSLRVPRHRNRSRSLDNSIETRNSFAAFKESLKLRDVKRTRLGT